jgi:hypothetical protein
MHLPLGSVITQPSTAVRQVDRLSKEVNSPSSFPIQVQLEGEEEGHLEVAALDRL